MVTTLAYFGIQISELPPKLANALSPYIGYWEIIYRDINAFVNNINWSEFIQKNPNELFSSDQINFLKQPNNQAALKEGLFTLEDIKQLKFLELNQLSKPECIQALRDKSFSVMDLKGMDLQKLSVFDSQNILTALREKRITIADIKQYQAGPSQTAAEIVSVILEQCNNSFRRST